MNLPHIDILVEEPSMEAALDYLAPRIIGGRATWKVINFGSKSKLLTKLPARLRGYRNRVQADEIRLLVLLDRDRDDCRALKQRLEGAATAAGLATKSRPDQNGTFRVVNRVVIEELEAWFIGDPGALCQAFPRVPATFHQRTTYRRPDNISDAWEALVRLLHKSSYRNERFSKIDTARRVAAVMVPEHNRSPSFGQFSSGLRALVAAD